jgi:uncharacterized membrane protein (DUF2068 family)
MPRARSDFVIRLIALFKLVKAAALIAVGLDALAVDPHGKYLTAILAKITSLHARQLREIGIACLLYALVFLVEGVGLLGKRIWAEVMTVIVTTSFIPLEVYELVVHTTLAKIAVILFNIGVVLYLLRRLKREQHWPFHKPPHATGA